jgi:Bacterial regulatory proteins, tetR family
VAKADRRVQRTRELLQKALIELISERGYYAVTIQDIVDRANVGRTTYYLHSGTHKPRGQQTSLTPSECQTDSRFMVG